MTGTLALSGCLNGRSPSPPGSVAGPGPKRSLSLRQIVGSGFKVAVECVLIAADQGAIGIDNEVVAVAVTRSGADTVCVIRPGDTASFLISRDGKS